MPNKIFLSLCLVGCVLSISARAVDFPVPLTGLVAGQAMRLSVVNTTPTTLSTRPCTATLGFVDSQGQVIPVSGAPTTSVTVAPGASAFLDLPAPDGATGVAGRFSVRPVVQFGSATCLIRASAHVFDMATGATLIALPQDTTVPAGPFGLFAPYGLTWVGPGQIGRLSVTNVSGQALRNDTCTVQLSYADANGQPVTNGDGQPLVTQVSLPPGGSAALDSGAILVSRDLAASAAPASGVSVPSLAVRPLIQRVGAPPALSPQCVLTAGFEVIDRISGGTVLSYPPVPVYPPQPIIPAVGQ